MEGGGNAPELDLIKFPRTHHIFDAGGGVGRDDLLMSPEEAKVWHQKYVYVEEKVDGSNLGISLTADYQLRFQNRSHFVNTATQAQWGQLEAWVQQHPGLLEVLTPDRILFGEWMYARHSIHYTHLPDLFIAFDIYDKKQGKFLSVKSRNELLEGKGIAVVPLLAEGVLSREDMQRLLDSPSSFRGDGGFVEGIYVRIDQGRGNEDDGFPWHSNNNDKKKRQGKRGGGAQKKAEEKRNGSTNSNEGEEENAEQRTYLLARAKVVRHDFLEEDITHWSRQKLVKNIVRYE
ncbi:ERI1 exoribonuclease 3 [Balamuthia mandrillaris]